MSMKDLRRQDRRSAVHTQNPFWAKSAIIDKDAAGTDAVLFSFTAGSTPQPGVYAVHAVVTKIEEAFDGGAALTVGLGSIATDDAVNGDTVTVVDADYFEVAADITEATPGYYPAASGQFSTDLGAGKMKLVIGADATVPVIYCNLTSTNQTVGQARILALISRVD